MRKMKQLHDPRGKTVAITGGARGIGLATAEAFVAAGARVAIGDIDDEVARKAADAIGATAFAVDVSDGESFAAFLDRVEGELGALDVLVNNAGIMPLGPLADETDRVTRRIVEINLIGALFGTKLATRRMVPRGRGHIINVASAVGRFAVPNAATYSATKFGVLGLTQAARAELRGTGVHASVILPSLTNTDLVQGLEPRGQQGVVEPRQVAEVIVGTVRRPRFETWVPRAGQRAFRIMSILPLSVVEAAARASGATAILATPDVSARADYERRARDENII